MKSFNFSVPQDIIVGAGSIKKLGECATKLGGTHALIISGPHLNKMGLVDTCKQSLADVGIPADAFTETEGNPSVETVDKATKMYKECGADFIVAFGGGSPMDVAKAVGVVAKYGGSITEYEGGGKVPGPIVPQIAIPTTAGTGSEVTAFSVITDHSRNYKLTVFSYELIPKYAILDPDLIATAPASVAAACGMDAFIHACESYISTDASPFSDVDAASDMLVGSLFAGIAFSWARLGNVHAMSHPVSAYFDVPHGVANAILLPTILDYNKLADKGKYKKIYEYVSETHRSDESFTPDMLVDAIRALNDSLSIPATLAEVGVTEDKIDVMADDAMKSGNIMVNPRRSTKKDIVALYKKAM